MLKCKICGREFEASKKDHYVSRSNGKTGLMSSFGNEDECTLYDTFDCPICGCQMVMQERNREYNVKRVVDAIVSSTDKLSEMKEEHDADRYVVRAPKLFSLCREYRENIKAKKSGEYYVNILDDILHEMKEKIQIKEEENRNLKEELEEVSPDCYREYDESNSLCADCPIVKRCRRQKII